MRTRAARLRHGGLIGSRRATLTGTLTVASPRRPPRSILALLLLLLLLLLLALAPFPICARRPTVRCSRCYTLIRPSRRAVGWRRRCWRRRRGRRWPGRRPSSSARTCFGAQPGLLAQPRWLVVCSVGQRRRGRRRRGQRRRGRRRRGRFWLVVCSVGGPRTALWRARSDGR